MKSDIANQYATDKANRVVVRSKMTKAINCLNKSLQGTNVYEIKDCLKTVCRLREDLDDRDASCQILMTHHEAVLDADAEISQQGYMEPASKIIAQAQRVITDLESASTAPTAAAAASSVSTSNKVKLPKVNLPQFHGKSASEYKTFINKFDSLVHNDASLDEVQKLLYLQSCCKDDALVIANGYAVTSGNYQQLREAFHGMFGLKRLVVQSYMETIIDLPDSAQIGLKAFLNTLETAVRSMKEYGIQSGHIAPCVIPLVERKLSKEDYRKWRELVHGDDDFSLDKLIKFLHERLLCAPPGEAGISVGQKQQATPTKQKAHGTTTFLHTGCQLKCNICNDDGHSTAECQRFVKANPKKRFEMAKERKLCFKCLERSNGRHYSRNCFASNCQKCGKFHHSLLHHERKQAGEQVQPVAEPKNGEVSLNVTPTTQTKKLLKTLVIKAQCNGKHATLRTIVDGASDEAWVTKEVKDRLKLNVVGHATCSVATAFSEKYSEPRSIEVVQLDLLTKDGKKFPVKAFVNDGPIVVPVKAVDIDPTKKFAHLRNLEVADAYPRGPQQVDLVLGTAYEEKIRTGKRCVGKQGPDAVETIFGWILSGQLDDGQDDDITLNRIATDNLDASLQRFWEIEEIPPASKPDVNAEMVSKFRKTARYDEEASQYVVSVPYNDSVKELLPNYEKVKRIMHHQEARLDKRPELKAHVQRMFLQQINSGIIERVEGDDELDAQGKHYLPWHMVIRPGHESTPVRIVYNLSNKDKNGLSLNSCQSSGPNLLPDTIGLLLQFRCKKIAFTMDIQKMFHQFRLDPSQVDLHRFLAFGEVYRFMVLIFGETASPFCALAACRLHAERMADKLPLACKVVQRCLYMDDPIVGCDDVEEGTATAQQLIQFFTTIHMNLHKLASNSKELLDNFSKSGIVKEKPITGILGLEWDTSKDTMVIRDAPGEIPSTKREVLSSIAKVFDPLGFHSPLTCQGKLIMQALWKEKCEWNEAIPLALQAQVEHWIQASKFKLEFPRYVGSVQELHLFADASEQAYAVAVYAVSSEGRSNLVMSKTKVKPLKVVTLPRMELMGSMLAANLFGHLQGQEMDAEKILFWTDSEIVLNWIQAESSDYKTFVGNRVSEIQTTTKSGHWLWTPSKLNPADIPSRGIWPLTPEQEQLWRHGPEFLVTREYPTQPGFSRPTEELRKVAINANITQPYESLLDVERFSKLKRLVNTMCYVFRFVNRNGGKGALEADERKKALKQIVKEDQAKFFAKDIAQIKQNGQVSRKSHLRALNPTLDDEGMLRMCSRDMHYNPIILHPSSHVTKLIAQDYHEENLHCGAPATLTLIREKFWIIRGLQTIKKITRACVCCRKANAPLCKEQMAPLPNFRVTPSHPFTHIGLDYAGPLTVTKAAQKRYILLFTCGSTRAVHLELTRTLNAKDFNLAFQRFIARRGKPTVVYSDNAKTFLHAREDAAKLGIDWKFITPRAPWQGAFYERMVRSIKEPLRKVLGSSNLNETELITMLTKVEAMLNERPLTAIVEGDICKPITPTMLVNGRSLSHVYEEDGEFAPTKRLQYLRSLERQFWLSWKKNYLPLLMGRSKWTNTGNPPNVGDVVLLLKEHQKRHTWPIGRITEAIRGRDGLVRSLKILVDGKELTRPIQHVVYLCGKDNPDEID